MGTLKVDGATLHYEVTGSGPVLLLIPGGPADAHAFAGFAEVVARDHAVVTYDPRGLSRSAVDAPGQVSVRTFADDAARLLDEVGGGPAYVLGSSGGGVVGLELLAAHPDKVRALVAHEPPAAGVLADVDAGFTRIHGTYLADGVGPAMGVFLNVTGLAGTSARMPEPPPEAMAGMMRNLEFFLGSMMGPMQDFRVDERVAALPVVIAVGEESEGQLAHRTAVALAESLSLKPVAFPGDHGGYTTHPEEFARRLREAFASVER
ncbi:alpha/beta fold hydrolase [Umezawaea tangerina]|uniref:Pimeloyl-ACP methyl ester carboxylesterase n=1 Tax=Umezawaea tangerina TaxID=84725 RepID=A0A2T0SX29_9PSEU|nr:alpha/beta hydrolase [Umezawaea tangerina]PRY37984.1 pimeloyl-ACP methyl ester carboxylesterase [Umezawaea tangerina]